MTVSQELVDFIKRKETLRLSAYRPLPTDRWTIGYGSTFINEKPVVASQHITEDEAISALTADLGVIVSGLSKKGLPLTLTRFQLDAVVSLVYNIGLTAFIDSDTGKLFYLGHDISNRFELWTKHKGKVIPGLVTRRKEERNIYVNGIYT